MILKFLLLTICCLALLPESTIGAKRRRHNDINRRQKEKDDAYLSKQDTENPPQESDSYEYTSEDDRQQKERYQRLTTKRLQEENEQKERHRQLEEKRLKQKFEEEQDRNKRRLKLEQDRLKEESERIQRRYKLEQDRLQEENDQKKRHLELQRKMENTNGEQRSKTRKSLYEIQLERLTKEGPKKCREISNFEDISKYPEVKVNFKGFRVKRHRAKTETKYETYKCEDERYDFKFYMLKTVVSAKNKAGNVVAGPASDNLYYYSTKNWKKFDWKPDTQELRTEYADVISDDES